MCAINTDSCAIKRDSKQCEHGIITKLYHYFFCNYSLNFVILCVFVLSTTLCLMILSFS